MSPLALLFAALLPLAAPEAREAAERCAVPVVAAMFPTDTCPWDEAPMRRAMAVAEAARWRCPALDAYAEDRLERLMRAAGVEADDAMRSDVLARGCDDAETVASFVAVQTLFDALLFLHLDAGLALRDAGEAEVVADSYVRFLPEIRAEHARLAGLDHPYADLEERAAELAVLARSERAVRAALWSQIIFWGEPLVRQQAGRPDMRLDRNGFWTGFRVEAGAPDALAVASVPLRLSPDGYPPGAAYGSFADAIYVLVQVPRQNPPAMAGLLVDVGWNSFRGGMLDPAELILRLAGEEWRETRPLLVEPWAWYGDIADFRRERLQRFAFGPDIVAALREAGDEAVLEFEILFADGTGGMASSDEVLEIDSGHCTANCAPRLPLRGFGDTLHWAGM